MKRNYISGLILATVLSAAIGDLSAQNTSNVFLETWEPRTLTIPNYTDVAQTENIANVTVNINFNDTITKISKYLFGDNVNTYTSNMSDNKTLMKYLNDRNMGVLRGPGGSASDEYFWNRRSDQKPTDIPTYKVGTTESFGVWYGKKYSWESWSMAIDSFYSILKQTQVTGMVTVNYGYARYGTGNNPVANAAHMAAEWVRYDKGRTKFWEIGNETFGSWETGYRIDQTLNKDGQPEYLNSALYGQHCVVFIDSMKKAAADIGVDIKIGVVAAESSAYPTWNEPLFAAVGDKADFYSLHSYYTSSTTATTVLNSYSQTGGYLSYVSSGLANTSKPVKGLALTEYNIGSGNAIMTSHINGLHAALVVGEATRVGFGAACRWAISNGGSDGNDHGMFAYNNTNLTQFTPYPAFYSMYFFRKYLGDVMVGNTVAGSTNIIAYSSKFNSGEVAATFINKGPTGKTISLTVDNYTFGAKYYTYTLAGGTDNGDFSKQTIVNGNAPANGIGGPANYATINANASSVTSDIKIYVPAYSMVVFFADKGTSTGIKPSVDTKQKPMVSFYPVPVKDILNFEVSGAEYNQLTIYNTFGKKVFGNSGRFAGTCSVNLNLPTGIYLVRLEGEKISNSSKIMVE